MDVVDDVAFGCVQGDLPGLSSGVGEGEVDKTITLVDNLNHKVRASVVCFHSDCSSLIGYRASIAISSLLLSQH